MKHLLLMPIRLYRKYISPAKAAPCCRFTPTCSAYAYRAINEWGFFIGLFLSVWRILRCQPFCKGGYNPIPRRRRKLIPKTEVLGLKRARKRAGSTYGQTALPRWAGSTCGQIALPRWAGSTCGQTALPRWQIAVMACEYFVEQ